MDLHIYLTHTFICPPAPPSRPPACGRSALFAPAPPSRPQVDAMAALSAQRNMKRLSVLRLEPKEEQEARERERRQRLARHEASLLRMRSFYRTEAGAELAQLVDREQRRRSVVGLGALPLAIGAAAGPGGDLAASPAVSAAAAAAVASSASASALGASLSAPGKRYSVTAMDPAVLAAAAAAAAGASGAGAGRIAAGDMVDPSLMKTSTVVIITQQT